MCEVGKFMIIGMCDDENLVLNVLEQHLIAYEKNNKNNKFEIKRYLCGSELLKNIRKIDAVFLDIDMPELDGIETGKRIIKTHENCKIIMSTGREDRYKEAFQIRAFRFITKPFCYTEIEEALNGVFSEDVGMQQVEVFCERNTYALQQRQINYVKAYNGYIEIYTGTKKYRKDCSLNRLEEELDFRLFTRISREIIVNFHFVNSYECGKIIMNHETFMVTRRRKKRVEQSWIEYDLKYRR